MLKPALDEIDRRILAALQEDGRLTNADLADRVGLSASPCLRRVRQLERAGYIRGYRAVLDRDLIGLGFSVFVGVKIGAHANDRAMAFEQSMLSFREVIACHLVSGDADYLLEVVVADLAAYRRFLIEKLLALPIVVEVRSNIALQTLKAAEPLPFARP